MKETDGLDKLSRRDFLKLSGLTAASAFVPESLRSLPPEGEWPTLSLDRLPEYPRGIIELTPPTLINEDGFLSLLGRNGAIRGQAPFFPTEWSRRRNREADRLRTDRPRAIVLHWFSDSADPETTIQNYIWGFDGRRNISTLGGTSYETTTSAHFLVGSIPPGAPATLESPVSIVQTQTPRLGDATLASHIAIPLDYEGYNRGANHYLSSLYRLGRENGFPQGVISPAQDWFRRSTDPNWYSWAIEVTGRDFDSETHPDNQKTANLLSVIWAIMKRDSIPATNLVGHYEVQLDRIDPGRAYLAELKLLLGAKALTEEENAAKELVFGPFERDGVDKKEAARRYFKFIRDYLVLTTWGYPVEVFDWEARSKYWEVYDAAFREGAPIPIADSFRMPIDGDIRLGNTYLSPENHEGVDINTGPQGVINSDLGTPIKAVANGECIYAEEIPGHGLGKTVIIRHRLPEGSEVISLYGHLNDINLRVGVITRKGQVIGTMGASGGQLDSHLHLAIAYGATWDTDMGHRPYAPSGVNATWIRNRYINPVEFIEQRSQEVNSPRELREE
ncbi:MAG TPA: peptidoglycan DD-metalloendopeptidase family protein [Patescibacteria group bacterium]|uniref:M23ase beta-sheet core domain-containing protein n=1 Tax=Candidatus Woesebacteria bacterium RBG_13_46_13 TaxID=1802479 RepID=A0A1F7X5H8_9BACT|nr:MAG: hypothetical protein A2Y68_02830 [Candidatus Woesebacteria bacterium RBG_13_46_13]HJX59066.1 peptidoglycan DD-metalloendopeptidase family protein [Patescibacteria group bacterium]